MSDAEIEQRDVAIPAEVLPAEYRQELDIWVATARAYPRKVEERVAYARELALMDHETAEQCYYVLPPRKSKDGKVRVIEGPSIRLAEIVASSWQHIRYGARIVKIDQLGWMVTAQAYCFDAQNNIHIAMEHTQPITIRTPDGIKLACAAASSIALRNAVFRVVPRAYVNRIYRECMDYVKKQDKKSPIEDRRAKMVRHFEKMGVTPEQILAVCDVTAVEQLTEDHLTNLRGIANAIRDGEASVKEAFPPIVEPGAKPKDLDGLTAELKAQKAEPVPPRAEVAPPEGEPVPAPEPKRSPGRPPKAEADRRKLLARLQGMVTTLTGEEYDELQGQAFDGEMKTPENMTDAELTLLIDNITQYNAAKSASNPAQAELV